MRPAFGLMLCLALLACAKPGEDHYGRGMDAYREKDYAAAANYLQQVADSGHVLGMATLAGMLPQGKGVPRDAVKAASWFEKAADQGYVEAQSITGLLYFNGIGVNPDAAKAHLWLGKAAAQGDTQSAWVLENLAERGAIRL